jgi:hypothetical protein
VSEDLEKIARRLSGALGRKIVADDIAAEADGLVELTDGTVTSLREAGNIAYVGDGVWMENGERLTEEQTDRRLR